MQDFATPILVIAISIIANPFNPILLMCPFAFSVFFECMMKKYSRSDSIFATLCVFLLFSGFFLMLLGIGLSSPIFTTNVSASNSINTKIFFNNQNLSIQNTTGTAQIFNGISASNVSILNISTNLGPQSTAFDFGMVGLVIGIVSLGVSVILSAVSTILTITKSYTISQLNNEQYRKIFIIWLIFGLIILFYGYLLSGLISDLMKLFGILYLDIGLLFIIIFSLAIHFEQNLSQKIQTAIAQLKAANQNTKKSRFSSNWLRDQINKFINGKKSMESLKIRALVVASLSIVLLVYGFWASFNPDSFFKYLPEVLFIGIGFGALTWALSTFYYANKVSPLSEHVSPPSETVAEVTTE